MRWGWKRESARATQEGDLEVAAAEPGPARANEGEIAESTRRQLERAGLPRDFCDLVVPRLEPLLVGRSPEAAAALLEGVTLSFSAQHEFDEQLAASLRGLKEVERMMGAFSGELSKLDEVLEVLAAYVRRMRSSGPSAEAPRIIH